MESKPHCQVQDPGILGNHQQHFPMPKQPESSKVIYDIYDKNNRRKLNMRNGLPSLIHTCSRTSSLGELSSLTKIGTAPRSITTFVFSDVPDAMFVRAQAASNCSKLKPMRMFSIHCIKVGNIHYEWEVSDLKLWKILPHKKLHKSRNNTRLNNFLNRRAAL